MILFENPNETASIVYDETTLTEEQKAKGIVVEALPTATTPAGKIPVLKCRKSTGEVWYDYVDKPVEPQDEIASLKAQQALMQQALDDLLLASTGGAI